jgi:hypothetical protein
MFSRLEGWLLTLLTALTSPWRPWPFFDCLPVVVFFD